MAVPVAKPETVVTLRELQEALEEEVLTRQSLSRELEAIRTANQNFSRSGSGGWVCWRRWSNLRSLLTRWAGSPSYPPTLQPTAGGRGPQPRPGGARPSAAGADGDAAGSGSCRRVSRPPLARRALGGDGPRWVCGHLGQGRSPGWGTPPRHCPFLASTLHTPLLFSFQLSRGSPVPGPRIHLPM